MPVFTDRPTTMCASAVIEPGLGRSGGLDLRSVWHILGDFSVPATPIALQGVRNRVIKVDFSFGEPLVCVGEVGKTSASRHNASFQYAHYVFSLTPQATDHSVPVTLKSKMTDTTVGNSMPNNVLRMRNASGEWPENGIFQIGEGGDWPQSSGFKWFNTTASDLCQINESLFCVRSVRMCSCELWYVNCTILTLDIPKVKNEHRVRMDVWAPTTYG
ncbi:hypothetical protein Pelo_4176 [Pelomyxa schiedti]|nr:hypothetical protein Pelo_4176 [Pelomyxa schiedti]